MNKIGVGLIGYGAIAKIHNIVMRISPIIIETEACYPILKKIYSVDPVMSDLAKAVCVDSKSDILESKDIELVDICTPNFTHKELALEAISHGKAVLLEKPLGLNYDEAKEILEKANETGIVNQTGFIYRFMPGINAIRELVADNSLGDIIDFKVSAYHTSYLNTNRPKGWNLDRALSGGGPILDLGIHLVDAVRFILGEVEWISAQGSTIIPYRPSISSKDKFEKVDVEDWGRIDIGLKNGGQGVIEVSRVSPRLKESTTFEISGTKGRVVFSVDEPWIVSYYSHITMTETRMKYNPKTPFGKHICKYYPKGSQSMNWLINAQFACLWNCYLSVAANKKIYDETPDFLEALKAQYLIEKSYLSLKRNGVRYKIET